MHSTIIRIVQLIFFIFLRFYYDLKTTNFDTFKKQNGCVLACNHHSWIDVVSIGVAIGKCRFKFLAKASLFTGSCGWVFELLNCMPITREQPKLSEMKNAVSFVSSGGILIVFPTGTRKSVTDIKRGIVFIAKKASAPIQVVKYNGPDKFHPLDIFSRKKRIEIIATEMISDPKDTNKIKEILLNI